MNGLLALFGSDGLLYAASGLGVGILVGLTGVGGGSLMTPLLILLFGIHPASAVGTDLLYAGITKTVGTAFHGFRQTIDWRITSRLALGSIPATLLTIAALHLLDLKASSSPVLKTILACTLALAALSLLLRKQILAFGAGRFKTLSPFAVDALTIACGATLGVLVSLTSVGAGAMGMMVLVMLYPGAPMVRLVSSDIAHAVPLTLIAGLGHWLLGSVDWRLLGLLLTGSIPGILIGSYLSTRIPGDVLRPILAVTLLIAARQLVS